MDTTLTFFHEFLIWALVCFGISFSITHSKVFTPLRNLAEKLNSMLGYFFNCPMCMGFWVGLLLNLIWVSPTGLLVLDGFLGLAVSWLIYCISWRLALRDPAV